MKYGLLSPIFGVYADPRALAAFAREAEAAGWDGFFVWDHVATADSGAMLGVGYAPMTDPWVALATIAMNTEHIRLGPMVTPLPRRRPWKLARETVALDHLSGGRLVLAVGAGFPGIMQAEFAAFGEDPDAKVRAAKLDEALDIITGLWSGQPFTYRGQHYQVQDTTFLPTPVQTPRIPIWVAALWPSRAPLRRAARWDGVLPVDTTGPRTPEGLRTMLAYVKERRTNDGAYDVVVTGALAADDPRQMGELVAPYIEAGATWWVENLPPLPVSLDDMRTRIRRGPPQVHL